MARASIQRVNFKHPVKVIAYGGPDRPPKEVNIAGFELTLHKGDVKSAYLLDDQGDVHFEDMREYNPLQLEILTRIAEALESLSKLWDEVWDSLREPDFPELPSDLKFIPGVGLGRR